jgi:hypothetical protein
MAARYWILGAGNWNDTAHWSTTSGGVGGASVPTMDDDVYFDSNSGTGTVTVNAIANMRNCTFAQTQLITLANAAYAFNIFGNWTLCSNTYLNTSFTGTGYIYLKATTSVNITSNGCTSGWNRLYFDGVGGTWTNQDDMNVTNNIYLNNGTWNTDSKAITLLEFWNTSTTTILTLGSSIFTCTRWAEQLNFNTFNYNTSTIILKSSSISIFSIYAGRIFYNLTFTGVTATTAYPITSNVTVSNTLTFTGSNASNSRLLIASNTIGTPMTITCNGTITASNVDLRDIVGAGTANWDLSAITGGSGDCGGNSGITFTPAQTQYFKHTLGAVNWSDATKWFSNYERTIQGRVPLPQDDAIFDENSFTGTSTLSVNCPRIGRSLNMEGVNQPIDMTLANIIECYGSYVLGSNITQDGRFFGRYVTALLGRGNFILNIFNNIIYSIAINNIGGIYTSQSNISCSIGGSSIGITNGTFDLNDFNFNGFRIDVGVNSTVYLGNGIITLTGAVFVCNSNATLYSENSTILFYSGTLSALTGGGKSYNKIQYSNSVLIDNIISGSNTIAELIIDSGRKVSFTNGTTQTINKLTAIGTPDQPITIGSTTAGQRHTINYTGSEASTVEYCNISDSKVTQARRLLAKNSVNAGNNQNWGFEELPPLALNFGQVDKMYVGGSEVVSAYYGEVKIK